jgi:enoyl-CoA hydratase/carnithine racemase
VPVTVTEAGPARIVTLDWPEKRNSLGPEDTVEVAAAIEEAGARARSAVVLTGAGAFCAGGDLRAFSEVSRTLPVAQIRDTVYGRVQRMVRALAECAVPTIAAVDGPAVGLGLDLALACDMRFVGPKGFLQQGWARAGLIAGTGGVGLLERAAPGRLWQLIATQERLGPERAAELGLAEPATGTALEAARQRAEELAAVERDVLGHYCRLSRSDRWPAAEHFELSAEIQASLIGSERFRAFTERILGAVTS